MTTTENLQQLQYAVLLGLDLDGQTPQKDDDKAKSPIVVKSTKDLANAIIQGEYLAVLQSPVGQRLFGTHAAVEDAIQLDAFIQSNTQQYLGSASFDSDVFSSGSAALDILLVGIASLYAYVQEGWTGPAVKAAPVDLLPEKLRPNAAELDKKAMEALAAGGESVYHLTPRILFLYFAKLLIVDTLEALQQYDETKTAAWWAVRVVFLQQRTLSGAAGDLKDYMLEQMDKLEQQDLSVAGSQKPSERKEMMTRFWIERGLVLHYYTDDKEAYQAFQTAQTQSGFRFKVTGALGKRTKFQQYDVSQLVVVAESSEDMAKAGGESTDGKSTESGSGSGAITTTATKEEQEGDVAAAVTGGSGNGPKNIELGDDTLLDKIQFSELSTEDRANLGELEYDPAKEIQKLHPIDHALLLAFCLNIKNTNPAHGLTVEQMFPFVTRVLDTPNNWTVYTMALLLRSRLESDKSRTVERGALQMQALVDQTKIDEDATSTIRERMHHFFSVPLPAKWEMEKELAERYMALGVVRSALDIFERLELWEDVIACHRFLSQDDLARARCVELLAKEPNTPRLLVILGDLDQDPEKYKQAWEVSGGRFARAQRSLGAYYFKHEQFEDCIASYEQALAINPLFENSWYVLGCAAMQVQHWDTAIRAFTRVVTLESANGEAWNNLAAVHMRKGNNIDAHHALRQALKEKGQSWKIWANYMHCSIDIGEFTEAMRAMGMVVEIRYKQKGTSQQQRQQQQQLQQEDQQVAGGISAQEQAAEDAIEIVDIVVLDKIVQGVTRDLKDLYQRSVVFQANKVEELLLGITNRVPNDPRIWKIAAKFYLWRKDFAECLECHLRAYRSVIHDPKIESDQKHFERGVEAALEMVDCYRSLGPQTYKDDQGHEVEVEKAWAYRSKQLVKSLMARTRDSWEGTAPFEKLVEALEDLKSEK
ncbi:hypothetical protein DFQ26_004010 [Actinomortierella ambigua]|nr:hypothetical protein DFQ26_004010 [Actinomortierella ambigua]